MADAFETLLVTWLAFAFLPERPTRSQGGTDGSNPLSSSGEMKRRSDELRVLDEVGGMADDPRHQHFARRQFGRGSRRAPPVRSAPHRPGCGTPADRRRL